jgi:L-alanine-DL-glutamate epimerase-like enolase superfamily enzyme
MPAGAARNAVDCALWDWEAKHSGTGAAALAGLPAPGPVTTAFTLSLGSADAMAARAASVPSMPLLKLKLGGVGDAARLRAVRVARPDARLIADANEAWTPELLPELLAVAAETGIEVVEQPLPAGADAALAEIEREVPVCADEALHTRAELAALAGRYDAVNIKLDKAGGLTEALALAAEARAAGLRIMVGCMVATSLAMAPALLVAQDADWVDLDGPLLLARDRQPGLAYEGALVHPAPPGLWG